LQQLAARLAAASGALLSVPEVVWPETDMKLIGEVHCETATRRLEEEADLGGSRRRDRRTRIGPARDRRAEATQGRDSKT
jgi:hypothetical protein